MKTRFAIQNHYVDFFWKVFYCSYKQTHTELLSSLNELRNISSCCLSESILTESVAEKLLLSVLT